jgi:hypothetical protein
MSCWIAPRDVPFGANYGKAILDAIEAAELFVVLLSASANKSIHVTNEIERAASYGKTIIPLRLENVKPSREIEFHISARQWVDLFAGPQEREQNMRRFFSVLRDILRAWLVPDLPPLGEAQPVPERAPQPAITSPPHRAPAIRAAALSKPNSEAIVSSPELRNAVSAELKKASHGGLQSLAVTLFRTHGAHLIPELCLLVREEEFRGYRSYLDVLIKFAAVQPSARRYTTLVFETMIACLQEGGPSLSEALDIIKQLPVSRVEKWHRLFELFPAVHLEYGYLLVKFLIETAPAANRDDLCRALAEVIYAPTRDLQEAAIGGIRVFGYRAAIPDLRNLVEATSEAAVAVAAAQCLSEWRDTAAAPSVRSAIASCTVQPSWSCLAECLRQIEGPSAAEFLVEQFMNLAEEQQRQALYGFWDGFKALNPKSMINALEGIAANASDSQLRELAENRLSELRMS